MRKRCDSCNAEILDSYSGHGEVDVYSSDMTYKHSICPSCALWGFKKKDNARPKFNDAERECNVCGAIYIPRCANAVVCSDECRKIMSKRYHDRADRKRKAKNATSKAC